MSLAAETREAVRARPFVLTALRAGVVNYSAAAAWLAGDAGLDGDPDAIATALRRFREDLAPYDVDARTASVSMRSGIGVAALDRSGPTDVDDPDGPSVHSAGEPALSVAGTGIVPDGDATAIVATGDVDAPALAAVLARLSTAGIETRAAGVAAESLIVVVGRREGANAVRAVEAALDTVPDEE
ncbi:DUF7523 family protein [Halorubrum sp. DTA98]|uniref:DUF7523 family protein n=1 Tax=Halorubrum sp. DTA98 TaxID=3402163 RepID=UPI003AAE3881